MFGKKQDKKWNLLDESPYRKSYHQHFEGYYEYAVEDEKGRKKIKRVYAGTYYIPQLSDAQRKKRILLYWLLWAAAIGACIFAASVKTPANTSRFMAVLQLLLMVCFIWLGLGLVNYSFSPKTMTAAAKKTSVDYILLGGKACAFFALFSAAAALVYSLMRKTLSADCLYIAAGYLTGTAILLFLRRTEKAVVYIETQSTDTIPDDAVEL